MDADSAASLAIRECEARVFFTFPKITSSARVVKDRGDEISHTNMLWILFLKIYAVAAFSYLAVAAGYFSWRVWQRK